MYIHELDDWPDFRWDRGKLAGNGVRSTVDSSAINLTFTSLNQLIIKIYAENRSCFHRNKCGEKT
jgi:hypothetical protein